MSPVWPWSVFRDWEQRANIWTKNLPYLLSIRKFQQFMNLWARNCGWRPNIYFLKVSLSQAHHIWVSFEMRNLCNQSQNIKCWKPKDKTVIEDYFSSFLFFLQPWPRACRVLVLRPGIESGPEAVRVQSAKHWATIPFFSQVRHTYHTCVTPVPHTFGLILFDCLVLRE